MEDVDELNKAAKSNPSDSIRPQNPPERRPASRGREEGELSSSSNDDKDPASSSTQFTNTVNTSAVAGPTPVTSFKQITKGIPAGKAISRTNPTTTVNIQSQPPVKSTKEKSVDSIRVPFKSSDPGWSGPPGTNNNLVISFSDDDSGSESESYRGEKALEFKWRRTGMDGSRRVPPLSLAESSKAQQTTRNVQKVMPKKLPPSHTYISSKMNAGTNSRFAFFSPADSGFQSRNFKTLNGNLSTQEQSFDQTSGLSNSKLQDLRQQIALRERELKLKAIQQNKESVSVSGKDYNAVNLSGDSIRKLNATSADIGQLEPKEPDRKRMKTRGSYSTPLNSDGQQDTVASKSILLSNEQPLQDRNLVALSNEGSLSRRVGSSMVNWKKHDDKRADISSENTTSGLKNGANVHNNSSQSEKSSMQKSQKLNNLIKIGGHQPPGSFVRATTSEHFSINSHENHNGISDNNMLEPSLNNASQASLDKDNLWSYLGTGNVLKHGNIDAQSLVEMEESLDKELEEAQEHRRKCEIEERNALKAYRKSQRALLEANARCTELYRGRELYSSHIRSLIMNDASLLWSSTQHEHVGIGLNPANDAFRSQDLIPISSHLMQAKYDGSVQPQHDLNVQRVSGAPQNASYQHVNGQKLRSEPCSEQDASTSEPLVDNSKHAADGATSPSNDVNTSADEDEDTFPLARETMQPNFKTKQREEYSGSEGRQKDANCHPNKNISTVGSQDSLVLEATLRSELFARLGTKTLLKSNGSSNLESADELGTENDNGSEKTQASNCSVPLSEADKIQEHELGGNDKPERSISERPIQMHNEEKTSNLHPAADSEDDGCSIRSCKLTSFIVSPTLVLRSAFSHMKTMPKVHSLGLQDGKFQQEHTCDYGKEEVGCLNYVGNRCSYVAANLMNDDVRDISERDIGSFTCNVAIEPFWPMCMFELRGKCNNDECPWQHLRDFSNGNTCQHQLNDSDSTDYQVGSTSFQQNCGCNGATKLSKYRYVLSQPTYLVALDILKADPHYESIVAQNNVLCWHKCFSFYLALPHLLRKGLGANEPFSRGSDCRIEVQRNSNRQTSYFHSRNKTVNHLNQIFSNTQSLEVALLMLSQDANKQDGMKKALSMLSRAIEADPTSDILWTSYLLIYYSNINSVRKDDMFAYAIRHNDKSYGLWLMYINSRLNLNDRLAAYDAALGALCHQAPASNKDNMHTSACILDLSLQMMDCLCMSGNVEKAIQKIYSLFPVATFSDEPHSLLLSDILICLTISDKYMFWVCCLYLVIYRKLPDSIVQQFECEKELLAIEWPSVHLSDEEKQRAVELVETVVDSAKLSVNVETLIHKTDRRSAEHFALCHIRCMAALDGLEPCQNLLERYIELYPSCLEIVLISARARTSDLEDLSFEGYEEVLSRWPKEAPGIHCVWNQYIECALQKGGPDLAKELIFRWYNSFSKVQYPRNEMLDGMNISDSRRSVELASASSPELLIPNSDQTDAMFGYLNLTLAKLFQNSQREARYAIDRALKSAAPQHIKHCLREHAMFMLSYELQSKDTPISEQVNILNAYLDDVRAYPVHEPLSRQFINNIEKPRVQELIKSILSPISSDFSMVNVVLEVWYGPTLLPKKINQVKELVDFVEAILELVPSNYPLAFSVCKSLREVYNPTNGTSDSIFFWASLILVNTIFHAIPIAPESAWVDAAVILGDIVAIDSISESFYKKALSVYPFSIKLWKFLSHESKIRGGDPSTILEAAREKGIELG